MVLFSSYLAIVALILIENVFGGPVNEFQFDRIEYLNSTSTEGHFEIFTLRVAKFNHTTHVLNAKFEMKMNVTKETYEMEVEFYYNRLNNNQYTKSLIRVPRDSLCNNMDKYYQIAFSDEMRMKNHTNFPEVKPGQSYCPFQKVGVYLQHYVFSSCYC